MDLSPSFFLDLSPSFFWISLPRSFCPRWGIIQLEIEGLKSKFHCPGTPVFAPFHPGASNLHAQLPRIIDSYFTLNLSVALSIDILQRIRCCNTVTAIPCSTLPLLKCIHLSLLVLRFDGRTSWDLFSLSSPWLALPSKRFGSPQHSCQFV